jgi:hypothetical protein
MAETNPDPAARGRRARRADRGDNLYFDPKLGTFVWRKVHPETKKRLWRDTRQTRRDLARRVAVRFDDELREELAGVVRVEGWGLELAPLAEAWVAAAQVGDRVRAARRVLILRALADLRLRRASDLRDVAGIDERLRALGHGLNKARRGYQDPLRAFSRWLAGNHRHLPTDPLASWELLPTVAPGPDEGRRALMPAEAAGAFLALLALDRERSVPALPLIRALFATGARIGALLSRTVADFDPQERRIDLGPGVGRKRRGAGALDDATAALVVHAVGDRQAGALFLSPQGRAWDRWTVVDAWRGALGLWFTADFWPDDEDQDPELVRLVTRTLETGKPPVSKGGSRLRAETVAARAALARRVEALADRLREAWADRLRGCDVHAIRKTHRTWAEVSGVPAAVIDAQIGHADAGHEGALGPLRALAAGSTTGRRFYLDLRSPIFEPRRSAEAVCGLLDAALAELADAPRARLLAPVRT